MFHLLVLLLLGLYRPNPGCSRCDDYSEDNGTCTAGKLCQRLQICCCEAGDEACDYNSENDTAFACRRNDNSKEHAKQRNAQCTYNAFWQRCTGDNAAGCANRPAWNGYCHASIVIVLDIPIETLRTLNPQYKMDIIPATIKSYTLVLPQHYLCQYIASEEEIHRKDSTYLKEYINPANIEKKKLVAS